MIGLGSFALLSVAVFFGAFVSSLAGFAFSAVAGAVLLHMFQPLEAVPLMMACSVLVQAANLWALRKSIRWRESLTLILGGLLGVPTALWLVHNVDARTFQQVFGMTIAIYSSYMLFKPSLSYIQQMSQSRTAVIGFCGGLIGGLTAMPGALPTIWCDMHGLPKTQQRGLVQPFIAAMQIFAQFGYALVKYFCDNTFNDCFNFLRVRHGNAYLLCILTTLPLALGGLSETAQVYMWIIRCICHCVNTLPAGGAGNVTGVTLLFF